MSHKPSPAEVLRFIAAEEPLEKTLSRFPAVSRRDLETLIGALAQAAAVREAAVRAEARQEPGAAAIEPSVAKTRQAAAKAATAKPPPPPAAPRGGAVRALRVYSDGAARGNPGPAGAGAVLMTLDGEIVERLGRYLGRNTNNVAEYMGLIIGLERARELGAEEVHVFADSELMIRQLGGQYQVRAANLKPLFDQATSLLRGFRLTKLNHVRRELNAEADEMSNRAIDERM
ncbi:ribonuclease HI family protein [Vulgatibacter incomptus]|uniref:Ribonuclease H n=1 Tax=Vulgatibacter incomptus TaxID=1391653 RepID=A0A0K1P8U7_9BACT|nr:ribonuclease HI family protein [Vulgatibacter incomptus]AKU89953.1 ribonuclease H [Vulgatibacter incomptus]